MRIPVKICMCVGSTTDYKYNYFGIEREREREMNHDWLMYYCIIYHIMMIDDDDWLVGWENVDRSRTAQVLEYKYCSTVGMMNWWYWYITDYAFVFWVVYFHKNVVQDSWLLTLDTTNSTTVNITYFFTYTYTTHKTYYYHKNNKHTLCNFCTG